MGTVFRLVFYASSESQANQLSRLAFEKIDRLNDIFSDYDERSEVSRLSFHAGSGKKIRVSNELWDVLSLSKTISAQSNGSFDITIGPASKLWRRAIRRNTFPEQKAIEQAQSLVNWKWLILDAEIQSAELVKDGMRLDLGGIAKGFTVDQVFELFESHGLTRVLIDGGGDIYVGDPPPGKEGWKLNLSAEVVEGGIEGVIIASNRAFAGTGSDYKSLKHRKTVYSHVVDPDSGEGVTDKRSIYLSAPNCALADALATAISVAPPDYRKTLLAKFDDCQFVQKEFVLLH